MLCCILTLLSGCKDDDDNPLRFYNSEYEVPMGGRRYLGLESGNGDYSLAVNDLSDSNRQRHTRNLHFTNQGGR